MNQLDRMKCVFVGVDLHKNNHVAVLTDCFGDKIKAFNLKNALSAFPAFVEQVKKKADKKEIVFGLEDVNFYGRSLAKHLLDAGYIVKEVNASYTKKQRSIGTNHNKSDELDALAVAKTLIFEYKRLPFANPQDVYLAIKQTLNTRNNYAHMAANIKCPFRTSLFITIPYIRSFSRI